MKAVERGWEESPCGYCALTSPFLTRGSCLCLPVTKSNRNQKAKELRGCSLQRSASHTEQGREDWRGDLEGPVKNIQDRC